MISTQGPLLAVLTGHTDTVGSVTFSPDGTRLATTSYDRTARLWDTTTHEVLATLTGHTGPVYSVTFSPDGTRPATGSDDGTAGLWRLAHLESPYTAICDRVGRPMTQSEWNTYVPDLPYQAVCGDA